jgi:hypothetical protein
VLGGAFLGDVSLDFYGGQQPSTGGRTFPLLRLRTARAIVHWQAAEVLVGQETPLIAGLNPVSPSSVGTPDFVAAGNLWLWLPQIRLSGDVGSDLRLGAQIAVLAPTSGDAAGAFDTDLDAAERSGRPYLQARVRARWGEAETAGEVGCGVHQGWIAVPGDARLRQSQAFACDAKLPLTRHFELRGEGYAGQALRGLGGGAIGQNIGAGSASVPTRAGWMQMNVKPAFALEGGGGCGVDDPDDAKLPAGSRLRNAACAAYAILRPSGPLFMGLEYRRIRTTYAAGPFTNDHLAIALGFEF